MAILNEQTIKRLQKLAGIQEIRVIKPRMGSLKSVIEPTLKYIDNENPPDPFHDEVYNILIGWVEGYINNNDPTGEYTRNIQYSLEDIKKYIEDGDAPQELINWIEKVENLPPNQIYIYNNGPYESFKFTTDPKGDLYASTPSGISDEDGVLLSKYNNKGNLVPNN